VGIIDVGLPLAGILLIFNHIAQGPYNGRIWLSMPYGNVIKAR
jgi:hypothetical protein